MKNWMPSAADVARETITVLAAAMIGSIVIAWYKKKYPNGWPT